MSNDYPDNDTILRIFRHSTIEIFHATLHLMWNTILQINSVLLALSALFLVYSAGNAILTWTGKQFLLALLLFAFLSVIEIAIAALQEP